MTAAVAAVDATGAEGAAAAETQSGVRSAGASAAGGAAPQRLPKRFKPKPPSPSRGARRGIKAAQSQGAPVPDPPPDKEEKAEQKAAERESLPSPEFVGSLSGRKKAGPGDMFAGVVLGALLWTWVALPFLKGGATGVKNVWRAKFFNKGPDGHPLP